MSNSSSQKKKNLWGEESDSRCLADVIIAHGQWNHISCPLFLFLCFVFHFYCRRRRSGEWWMWFWFLLALPEQYSRPNEPVSWTKEEKSGTHQLNLTTFPVANSTANDDAPSWHAFSSVTSFLFVAVFWRLRGRSNGDVNPSDSQAKRSHTSVSHVFLWMDIEGIFPFYSIGFFPRAFTLRAMMFAWNWHRNRRHPNFVPSKRRSAWNFRNELYNFFFSLSSFAAATSPSLSTTTVTIKQKNSKLQEKDFFPRSNFEQSSRMTPCQVNWKGLPPLLLV